MSKIPLIIDTDPGHDDIVAIILALASDCIDVKAITTIQGNQTLDKTTANALRITEFIGSDVPVAMGRKKPLISEIVTAKGHGTTGLDGSTMPPPKNKKPADLSAVEMMAQVVEASPEPVTICVLGPCGNIATFILAYPHLIPKIKRLSMMGGGYQRGNITPAAEMNFYADPLAAAIVFKSGIPITLFALDVTLKTGMTEADMDRLKAQRDPLSREMHNILSFYQESCLKRGRETMSIHDACTVAWLVDPTLFSLRPGYLEVDCRGRYTKGASIIDFGGGEEGSTSAAGKSPNVLFATGSRREAVVDLVLSAIRKVGESM